MVDIKVSCQRQNETHIRGVVEQGQSAEAKNTSNQLEEFCVALDTDTLVGSM